MSVLTVIFFCILMFSFGFSFGIYYCRNWSKKFIENHENQLKANLKVATANFDKVLKDFELRQKEIDKKLAEEYKENLASINLENALLSGNTSDGSEDEETINSVFPYEKPKKPFLH